MKQERLYFVDWLRVLVILTLVPFHSALTYTDIGDIYIKSPIKGISVLPFLIVIAPLDNFFMTLLFFLSGIGTYYAIQYRNEREYRKERAKKLLIPFIFGTILLCPIQAFPKALYDGFSGDFLHFIPQFFSKKIVYYLGYAHLWFLLYLFIFSLCCLPLFTKWLNDKTKMDNLSSLLCKGNKILMPIGFICLSELFLRPFSGSQTIIGDWANDVIYSSMFIFGFVYAYDSKIQERINQLYKPAKYILTISIPVYVFLYYKIDLNASRINIFGFFGILIKGIYECSAIIVLMKIGRHYLNKKSILLSYLNKASFSYYLIHLLPVSILTYYFINTKLNVYIKFLLVVIFSYIFIFTIYEIVIRRLIGGLRKKIYN